MKRGGESHAREEGERYGREEEEAISEAGAGAGSMHEAGANKAILNIHSNKAILNIRQGGAQAQHASTHSQTSTQSWRWAARCHKFVVLGRDAAGGERRWTSST